MSLEKYQGVDLKDAIISVKVEQGKAKETGNPYYYINMDFVNGYSKRIFLKSEEEFAWSSAFDKVLENL